MRFWFYVAAFMSVAGPVLAGAWPREEGQLFVSFSRRYSDDLTALRNFQVLQPESYTSLYAEYGATPRLTFGLDAGYATDGRFAWIGFGRYALGPEDARHRFALVAGAGAAGPPEQAQFQLGGAWGYGFTISPKISGWAGLDASAIYRLAEARTILKADLTLGIKPSPNWMAIVQLQTGQYPASDPYLRAAPSVVFRLGGKAQLQVGVDFDLTGTGRVGGSLATWFEF